MRKDPRWGTNVGSQKAHASSRLTTPRHRAYPSVGEAQYCTCIHGENENRWAPSGLRTKEVGWLPAMVM